MGFGEIENLINSRPYFPVIVRDEARLKRVARHFADCDSFAFDTETISVNDKTIVGFSIANSNVGYYVPLGHKSGGNIALDAFKQHMKPVLEDPDKVIICHNAKFDLSVLAQNFGIYPAGKPSDINYGAKVVHDTMVMSWMMHVGQKESNGAPYSNGLKENAVKLGLPMTPLSEILKEWRSKLKTRKYPSMDLLPVDVCGRYAALDAIATWRLWLKLRAEIEQYQFLKEHYYNFETRYLRVLNIMELEGYPVDVEYLSRAAKQLDSMAEATLEQIHDLVGFELAVTKNREVAKLYFEKLGLPVLNVSKKTGEPSLDAKTLQALADKYGDKVKRYGKAVKALPLIVKYRNYLKMKSTYCTGVLSKLDSDGRIHTDFKRFGTETGRLSSASPNLTNLPREESTPVSIRQAFIPPPGHKLLVLDYSQLELRVLAHFSKSPSMLEAYRLGRDLHSHTAVKILNALGHRISYDDFVEVINDDSHKLHKEYKPIRSKSKSTTFGIIYGMHIKKLAAQLGISEKEAQEFWELFHNEYREIQPLIKDVHKFCRDRGFVVTLCKRRRYFPDINDRDIWVARKAERGAFNCVIQGSAADIVQLAMIDIAFNVLTKPEFKGTRMVLQVHDELHFFVPDSVDEKKFMSAIVAAMENPQGLPKFRTKLVAEGNYGSNWKAAK